MMKVRDSQLYDDDAPAHSQTSKGPSKPFRQHLLETRGAAVPMPVKVLLWAAAAVVGLLLILAVYRFSQPKAPAGTSAPRAAIFESRFDAA